MYHRQAQVAANWWIEEMKKHSHELYPDKFIDNGIDLVVIDHSFADKLYCFHTLLTDEIKFCLEKRSYLSLTCYYTPNAVLSKIARTAGISHTCFPVNANMEIINRTVQVSTNSQYPHQLPLPVVEM